MEQLADRLSLGDEVFYLEARGHTDALGSEEHNLRLGHERAEAVRGYLCRASGLPAYRIAAVSYGESQPVADNSSAQGRALNRRVEVVVSRER